MKKNTTDLIWLSKILDNKLKGPFNTNIGLDGIIGLIPVVGDGITVSLSFYIVIRAISLGYPKLLIAKMILNIIIDSLIGFIPVLGDFFDFINQSNTKNIELLKSYDDSPFQTKSRSIISIAALSLISILIVLGLIYLIYKFIAIILTFLF